MIWCTSGSAFQSSAFMSVFIIIAIVISLLKYAFVYRQLGRGVGRCQFKLKFPTFIYTTVAIIMICC